MAVKITVIATILAGLTALVIWTGEVSLIALVGTILFLCAAGAVGNMVAARKVEAVLEVREGNAEKEYISVDICLKNRSIFPVFKGKVQILVENLNFRFSARDELAFSISGKSEQRLSFQIRSDYCGKYRINLKKVRCIDLWGLSTFGVRCEREAFACMFPKWERIGGTTEALRANYEKEKKFSGRKGNNLSDVLQYREYQNGDSMKHVNWKLTAKYGKCFVREFDTPVDNQILIIPDIVRGETKYQNLAYIVLFSICMSYVQNNINYQLGYVESNQVVIEEINTAEDLFRAMRDILSVEPNGKMPAAELIAVTEDLYKYAHVVCVTNSVSLGEKDRFLFGDNLDYILVNEKAFGNSDYKAELKKIAV